MNAAAKCAWIETAAGWETDCGNLVSRLDMRPSERQIFNCLECGREIEEFLGTEPEGYPHTSAVNPSGKQE